MSSVTPGTTYIAPAIVKNYRRRKGDVREEVMPLPP